MGKIRQSPKQPAQKRRRELLVAAKRLFVKKGYRGTTTEEIARAARLTKGALYHHFESKEEVLFALVDTMLERFRSTFAPLAETQFAPGQFARIFLEGQAKDNFREFRNLLDIWVQSMRIPRIRRFLFKHYEDALSFFTMYLDPRYGRTTVERRRLGIVTIAFIDGLAARLALDPKSIDLEAQLRIFTRVMESECRTTERTKRVG
jgi:AcrR family transcriptional regulator